MIKEGEWRANALFKGYVSFHTNSLYSLMPNAECRMPNGLLVAEFLRVNSDPFDGKTFEIKARTHYLN
ncbi:hypothetical protein [Commensalibacter communis]|uniref:hypothetical protein n=1 Tax=Commensalibacter communis TaxID=2972786 RepID=UPI00232C338C|nr:hypothetical protein [Commensalibacter communis]